AVQLAGDRPHPRRSGGLDGRTRNAGDARGRNAGWRRMAVEADLLAHRVEVAAWTLQRDDRAGALIGGSEPYRVHVHDVAGVRERAAVDVCGGVARRADDELVRHAGGGRERAPAAVRRDGLAVAG